MSLRDGLDIAGDRLRNAFGSMAPRERVLVAFTAAVLLAFVGYFATQAMEKSTRRVKTSISTTSTAQAQVDSMMAQYTELAGTVETLDARLQAGRDLAPLTWIETIGNEMNLSIGSMNERGTETTDYYVAQTIDVRIDDLSLEQIVQLMYRFESSPQAIRVTECRVKTDRKERAKLDLNLTIDILKPPEGV